MTKKRGRKSADELATRPVVVPLPEARRPDPPAELTAEQQQVWREIVKSMPADWFDAATLPLLSQYCRHVVEARRVSAWLDALTPTAFDDMPAALDAYSHLLRLRPETAGRHFDQHPPGPPPWEVCAARRRP